MTLIGKPDDIEVFVRIGNISVLEHYAKRLNPIQIIPYYNLIADLAVIGNNLKMLKYALSRGARINATECHMAIIYDNPTTLTDMQMYLDEYFGWSKAFEEKN